MQAWLEHYIGYDFLDSEWRVGDKHGHHHAPLTKADLAEELALLLGVAKPTAYDLVKEQTRLEALGERERTRCRLLACKGVEDKKASAAEVGMLHQGVVDKRGQLNPHYQARIFYLEGRGVLRVCDTSEPPLRWKTVKFIC